jgi:hypothetical protein
VGAPEPAASGTAETFESASLPRRPSAGQETPLTIRLMTPLPRPAAPQFQSFAAGFPQQPTHRATSLSEALAVIVRWLLNRPAKPSPRARQLETAILDRLALELEAEQLEPGSTVVVDEAKPAPVPVQRPKLPPKRPRRIEDPRPVP